VPQYSEDAGSSKHSREVHESYITSVCNINKEFDINMLMI